MRKKISLIMLLTPFFAIAFFIVGVSGWMPMLIIFCSVALIVIWVGFAVFLGMPEEKSQNNTISKLKIEGYDSESTPGPNDEAITVKINEIITRINEGRVG